MAEKMQKIGKIGKIGQITVRYTCEWDPEPVSKFILLPDTSVDRLIERFEKKIEKSGLAFFHGDVKLNGASTFAECNIPVGAILTVRKRKRDPRFSTAAPQKKRPLPAPPALGGAATGPPIPISMKAPVPVARSPTPPLPEE